MMKAGFIGLGNIGLELARNLQMSGVSLLVHDLDRSKATPLLDAGALWADSPAELASQVDVVLTSLPGPSQIADVMGGEAGVLTGIRSGSIWVELSTTERAQLLEIAEALAGLGCQTLDCPVTGGVAKAAQGAATLFVSGDGAMYLQCKPLLESMATEIFYLGALGNAMTCKLITNLLVFAHIAVLGEGLMIGRLAGLDLNILGNAINASFGASVVSERHMNDILDGSYDSKFSLGLAVKDLELIVQRALELEAPLHVGKLVQHRFEEAAGRYGPDIGDLNTVRLLEDEAGVSLRSH